MQKKCMLYAEVMRRNLMAPDSMKNLGYQDLDKGSTAADEQGQSAQLDKNA